MAILRSTFDRIDVRGHWKGAVSDDFALTRADESRAFDVILFTDPEPESGAELDNPSELEL